MPYAFSSQLGRRGEQAVEEAIKVYNEKTCVRWIKRTNEPDYVLFVDQGSCQSYIGKVAGTTYWSGATLFSSGMPSGAQTVSLGSGGCQDKGGRSQYMLFLQLGIRE